MTKVVVAAVLVIAAAAAADAVRDAAGGKDERQPRAARTDDFPVFVSLGKGNFDADGPLLQKRVLRAGDEYLSAEAVEAAFPVPVEGPLDISKIAVSPDGTLVLAVYRFPAHGEPRGALELWRGRRLVSAFAVPRGSFGGGLAFARDGRRIALFRYDGEVAVFDQRGRRLPGPPGPFVVASS